MPDESESVLGKLLGYMPGSDTTSQESVEEPDATRLRAWIKHFDTMTNNPRLRGAFASALRGDEPPES